MALRRGSRGPNSRPPGTAFRVSDLFERVRQSMPPSNPGAVTPAAKVDIISYLLKGNRIPAGTTELPKEAEGLKQIQYKASKP